jgi:hypothetical protein
MYSHCNYFSQAQQEVPKWLEEAAFSAHGTTGFNPGGRTFASTDSRKVWIWNRLSAVIFH